MQPPTPPSRRGSKTNDTLPVSSLIPKPSRQSPVAKKSVKAIVVPEKAPPRPLIQRNTSDVTAASQNNSNPTSPKLRPPSQAGRSRTQDGIKPISLERSAKVNLELPRDETVASNENSDIYRLPDDQAAGDNVKVVIRVRPLNPREAEAGGRSCLNPDPQRSRIVLLSRPEPQSFTFDVVADASISQEEFFNSIGKQTVETCISGYHSTVFAYGQTGSGKTYTMQGPMAVGQEHLGAPYESRGLIPRILDYLFQVMKREEAKSVGRCTFLVQCSYLEIYNETLLDLLDMMNPNKPHIREDLREGVNVENLSKREVSNAEETLNLLKQGAKNRHVGSTAMNHESSRSHSVFTLIVESKIKHDSVEKVRRAYLNLCDLAGSERQKAADTISDQLKEASNINKSLSALGNVIMGLVDIAEGKNRHIHYRDSKLTFLLKNSLGGNAKTTIIATVTPSDKFFGETLSTLKFAQRAKHIRNTAVINEATCGDISALQNELKRLRQELQMVKGGSSALLTSRLSGTEDGTNSDGSDLHKRIFELESLLAITLEREKQTNQQYIAQKENNQELMRLVEQKDDCLQKTRAALKLKAHSGDSSFDKELRALCDAWEKARDHPDVVFFFQENTRLNATIRELESIIDPLKSVEFEENKRAMHVMSSEILRLLSDKRSLQDENERLKLGLEDDLRNASSGSSLRSPSFLKAFLTSPQRRDVENQELEKWKMSKNFEEQFEGLRVQILKKQQELDDERRTHVELERVAVALQAELSKLKMEKANEKDIFQTQIKNLQASYEHQLHALAESYTKDSSQKQAENIELLRTRQELGEKLVMIASLEGQLLAHQTECSNLKRGMELVKEEAESRQQKFEQDIAELQSVNQSHVADISEMRSKLGAAEEAARKERRISADASSSLRSRYFELERRAEEERSVAAKELAELREQLYQSSSEVEESRMVREQLDVLTQEKEFLEAQVAEKEDQLTALRTQVSQLEDAVKQSEHQVREQREMAARYQEQLNTQNHEEHIQRLMKENAQLLKSIESTRKELEGKLAELKKTSAHVGVLESSVQDLRAKLSDQQETKASLEESLQESSQRLAKTDATLGTVREDLANLQSRCESLESDLRAAEEDKGAAEERLRELTDDRQAYEQMMDQKHQEVMEQLEREHQSFREERQRRTDVEEEVAKSKRTEQQLQEELQYLRAVVEQERKRTSSQHEEQEKRLASLRNQLAQSEHERTGLKERCQRYEEHTQTLQVQLSCQNAQDSEIEGLRYQFYQEQDRAKLLDSQLADAQSTVAELKERESRLAEVAAQAQDRAKLLDSQLADTQSTIAQLKEREGCLAEAKARAESSLARLQAQLEKRELCLVQAEADLTTLESQLKERESCHAEAKAQAEADLARLQAQLQVRSEQQAQIGAEVEILRAALKDQETSVLEEKSVLLQANGRLKSDLQVLEARLQGVTIRSSEERDRLQAQLANMQAKLEHSNRRFDDVTSSSADEVENLERQKHELEQKLHVSLALSTELERVSREHDSLLQQLLTQKQETAETRRQLQETLEREQETAAEARENLRGWKQQEQYHREALSRAEEQIVSLQAELARLVGHQNTKQKIHVVQRMKAEPDEQRTKAEALTQENKKLLEDLQKQRRSLERYKSQAEQLARQLGPENNKEQEDMIRKVLAANEKDRAEMKKIFDLAKLHLSSDGNSEEAAKKATTRVVPGIFKSTSNEILELVEAVSEQILRKDKESADLNAQLSTIQRQKKKGFTPRYPSFESDATLSHGEEDECSNDDGP